MGDAQRGPLDGGQEDCLNRDVDCARGHGERQASRAHRDRYALRSRGETHIARISGGKPVQEDGTALLMFIPDDFRSTREFLVLAWDDLVFRHGVLDLECLSSGRGDDWPVFSPDIAWRGME